MWQIALIVASLLIAVIGWFKRTIEAHPSLVTKMKGYLSLTGPGWLQSALTLGAGTAGSLLFAPDPCLECGR